MFEENNETVNDMNFVYIKFKFEYIQNVIFNSLSVSVAASYLRKHFSSGAKLEAAKMTKIIHEEFMKTLQDLFWMDNESKKAAITKAILMNFDIGYPDELVDSKKLVEFFNGLELQPNELLNNFMHINKFLSYRKMRRLHEPVILADWEQRATRVTKVDAFYAVSRNTIRK